MTLLIAYNQQSHVTGSSFGINMKCSSVLMSIWDSSAQCGKRESRDFKYVRKGGSGAGVVLFSMMRRLPLKMWSVLELGMEKLYESWCCWTEVRKDNLR